MIRWTFTDPETDETWTPPINPNKMSSPTTGREMTYAFGSRWGQNRIRAVDRKTGPPPDWTFSGVLLTKEHYDLLLEWSNKLKVLHIADHLGRTFEVVIKEFDPEERLPTATRPWRADYTITCMLLREVTA